MAALARTIEVFGPGCNLVACNPDAMLRFTDIGSTSEQLRTDRMGDVSLLKKYCREMGFQEWSKSGIYLLNPSTRKNDVLLE